MNHYQWLLFDADNTLLDFSRSAELAFFATLADFDLEASDDSYSIYRTHNHRVWTEFEEGRITQEELKSKRFRLYLEACAQEADPALMNKRFLENLVDHSILIEGTLELMDALKPHYKMSLITNGLKAVQRPRLQKTRIDHYFEAVIVSEEIGFAKPQKAFFDYTFSLIGNPEKSKVLVIGDSLNSDIRGGIDYGLDTVWYNPQAQHNASGLKPTFELEDIRKLADLLH